MDDEIKKRFTQLEAKIASLEAKHEDLIAGIEHGWDRHYQIHSDLNKMIYASYFKTHPEFLEAMSKFDEIVAGKINDSDEPKR